MSHTADLRAERAALVALLQHRPRGVTWSQITADVLEGGSAAAVWDAVHSRDLFDGDVDLDLKAAMEQVDEWCSDGTRMVTILEKEYPTRLLGIHQAPPVLFVRGQLVPDDRAVSIVGSRAASAEGVEDAAGIARAVAEVGVTVASGLAKGIDTAAHTAALSVCSRTVAFLGTGIRKYYPKGNEALQNAISRHGLLLSQFWPDAAPQRYSFLMRNAVMSGYGLATIVVEAGETSGSRAQARMAVEHGRPVILTERVVNANKWAQALLGHPGVRTARRVDEIVSIVESLGRMPSDASPAARALALLSA